MKTATSVALRILALLALAVPDAGLAEDRPAAAGSAAERRGEAMDHSQMDHSQMDHSQMDHSQMDHSQMDHSQMDHGQMNRSGHGGHAGHEMSFDAQGMVMNTNRDRLPPGCPEIRRDYDFEVRAGTTHARAYPGEVFGMSQHEFRVEPCSRVTFTFINEDAIRHQFMIHNLPRMLYPQGMFHLEAAGGATKTGSLIVPDGDKTYLVHCDIAQHMEQGMKGQLVAGSGSGDLTSIPGITARFRADVYRDPRYWLWVAGGGFVATLIGLGWWKKRSTITNKEL